MQKIRKILAPTDMSDLSSVGVRYALEMARELSAEVVVYHTVPVGEDWFSDYEKHGPVRNLVVDEETALDNFLAAKFGDDMKHVQIRQKVVLGVPYASIVEMAEREEVDLIVMSTHGRTGLSHMLLGSVTERVVAHAPCPVLAIPTHGRRTAKAA
ncbi:MAG: universal stress protein [Candidatus Binatia bacterium]|jgi:nucleotide-binding universal stress UspA family protein